MEAIVRSGTTGAVGVAGSQLPGQVKAAFVAEHDVHEDNVGVQRPHFPDGIGGIRSDGHHRHALLLEEVGGGLQEERVVIDNEAPEQHA